MTHVILFAIDKETKGTIKFKEVDDTGADAFDPKIGSLYVRKSAMGGKIRKSCTVTLELGE